MLTAPIFFPSAVPKMAFSVLDSLSCCLLRPCLPFCYFCMLASLFTHTLPLTRAPGDAGLRGPGGRAVCPQPPPAAVGPPCASEAERSQNRGSACCVQRRLLGDGGGCFLVHRRPSQRSVQRDHETPDSLAAGLGLCDTSLQVTSQEERPGCQCSLECAWGSGLKGRSHLRSLQPGILWFRLRSWNVLKESK